MFTKTRKSEAEKMTPYDTRRHQIQIERKTEYSMLGVQLKQTTRASLAEKFEISAYSVSTILKIDADDFRLIKAMLEERRKMLERRAQLRGLMNSQYRANDEPLEPFKTKGSTM